MPPRICPFQASVDDDRGEEMRAAFKIFDKNKDGFITRSELKVSRGTQFSCLLYFTNFVFATSPP